MNRLETAKASSEAAITKPTSQSMMLCSRSGVNLRCRVASSSGSSSSAGAQTPRATWACRLPWLPRCRWCACNSASIPKCSTPMEYSPAIEKRKMASRRTSRSVKRRNTASMMPNSISVVATTARNSAGMISAKVRSSRLRSDWTTMN